MSCVQARANLLIDCQDAANVNQEWNRKNDGLAPGFLIPCAVGVTGAGAGCITAPFLILFFHVEPAVAVGTALKFGAVIKLAALPIYLRREQINDRVLGLLCAGGIPGVVIGIQVPKRLSIEDHESEIFFLLRATIIVLSLADYRGRGGAIEPCEAHPSPRGWYGHGIWPDHLHRWQRTSFVPRALRSPVPILFCD